MNGHTTLDWTSFGLCFRSAERVTALFVCLARNALSRLRIIRRRRNCFRRHLSFSDAPRPGTRASCLGMQCGRFWCPRVGAMLPRACGRSHKEVCGRTSTGCALDCGQEHYGPWCSCGVGPCGGGLGGCVAGAASVAPGEGCLRVGCGAQRGEGVPRPGSHKEVGGQESSAQGGHVALAQGGPAQSQGGFVVG